MVQTPAKLLTLSQFLTLPETKPASQYMHGQPCQKPMPQGKHSRLQRKLTERLNHSLEDSHSFEDRAEAFPELRCTFGGRSIVPDISIFRHSRIPTDQNGDIANAFELAPDWTIEILSPNQSTTKVIDNILHCLQNGCAMGWLVDPAERSVTAYPKDQQPIHLSDPNATLPIPVFAAAFELTVAQLFAWLQTYNS